MILFFSLEKKEPKVQGCVCFATLSLHSTVRVANSLRSNSNALGRFVPLVRFTLTRQRPVLFLPPLSPSYKQGKSSILNACHVGAECFRPYAYLRLFY